MCQTDDINKYVRLLSSVPSKKTHTPNAPNIDGCNNNDARKAMTYVSSRIIFYMIGIQRTNDHRPASNYMIHRITTPPPKKKIVF